MTEKMVKVTVVVSKIQDGADLYRKGQELEVPESWAKARGTSVKVHTPAEAPFLPPETAPVEEVIVDELKTPQEEPDNVQGVVQRRGKEGERKGQRPVTKASPKKK